MLNKIKWSCFWLGFICLDAVTIFHGLETNNLIAVGTAMFGGVCCCVPLIWLWIKD